jgi:ribosomal protein S27AE
MDTLVMPLLLILSSLTLFGVIFVAVILWRIPKKCPRCGKKMAIASIQLICKKCGFVESN